MSEQESKVEPVKVTELVIDRSKWLRGEGSNASRLLRESDGKMCCLGMYGLACGLTPEDLLESHTPITAGLSILWSDMSKASGSDWLFQEHTTSWDCRTLMQNNDVRADIRADIMACSISVVEEEREKMIAQTFLEHGVTVTFVG